MIDDRNLRHPRSDHGGGDAVPIRTHPPPGLGDGVSALEFSGAFPFTKLGLTDSRLDGLEVDLFAYSKLKMWDVNASATPAAVFTIAVRNPGTSARTVSLMLALPLASSLDTSRSSTDGILATMNDSTAAACLKACSTNPACTSWDISGPGSPAVPPAPASLHNNSDCPGGDIFNVGRQSGMDNIGQCISLCNTTKVGCAQSIVCSLVNL